MEAQGTELIAPSCSDTSGDIFFDDGTEEGELSAISDEDVGKKKYVPVVERVLNFMQADSEKRYSLLEKAFSDQDSANDSKRLDKLEEKMQKILDTLDKLLKK